jgi:hypothetical protein
MILLLALIGQALALAAEFRRRHLKIHHIEWWAGGIIATVFVVFGGLVCLS